MNKTVRIPLPNVKVLTPIVAMINSEFPMSPIQIQPTPMMRTLIEIVGGMTEEGMTEERMIEEEIAIVIVKSLTGVTLTDMGPVVEEGIHHPIYPIRMTMTSMDADAPARITTIDKTDVKTAIEIDLDSPHLSSTKAP